MNVEKKGVANLIKAKMDWYALRARKRAGKSTHAKMKLCRLKSENDLKDWDVQVLTQESALISRQGSLSPISFFWVVAIAISLQLFCFPPRVVFPGLDSILKAIETWHTDTFPSNWRGEGHRQLWP